MNRVYEFIKYYLQAQTIQKIHSPIAFQFAKEVLENRDMYNIFNEIEECRQVYLTDERIIQVKDKGAGSKKFNSTTRKIKHIARHSISSEIQCKQLFHLIRWTGSKNILELGTSLGISTLYLEAADKDLNVYTIEASKSISDIARKTFNKLSKSNIHLYPGTFTQNLKSVLKEMKHVDFAFIDGHHDGSASVTYFDQIEKYCHPNSIIVIDDIYWSKSMKVAWEQICARENIKLSIDLFHYGVVFFSPELKEKQHFKLIEKKLKPFQIPW